MTKRLPIGRCKAFFVKVDKPCKLAVNTVQASLRVKSCLEARTLPPSLVRKRATPSRRLQTA
jgi:hypothetical protein